MFYSFCKPLIFNKPLKGVQFERRIPQLGVGEQAVDSPVALPTYQFRICFLFSPSLEMVCLHGERFPFSFAQGAAVKGSLFHN